MSTQTVFVSGEYEAEVLEHQDDDAVKVRSLETGRVYTVPASEIEYEPTSEIVVTRAQLDALRAQKEIYQGQRDTLMAREARLRAVAQQLNRLADATLIHWAEKPESEYVRGKSWAYRLAAQMILAELETV